MKFASILSMVMASAALEECDGVAMLQRAQMKQTKKLATCQTVAEILLAATQEKTAAEQAVTDLQSGVGGLTQEISELVSQEEGVQGEITGVQGEIAGVQGEIAGVEGDIETVELDIAAVQAELARVKEVHASHLADLDTQLREKTAQLGQKNDQLAQKNDQLAQKNSQLAQTNSKLATKNTLLGQKNTLLAEAVQTSANKVVAHEDATNKVATAEAALTAYQSKTAAKVAKEATGARPSWELKLKTSNRHWAGTDCGLVLEVGGATKVILEENESGHERGDTNIHNVPASGPPTSASVKVGLDTGCDDNTQGWHIAHNGVRLNGQVLGGDKWFDNDCIHGYNTNDQAKCARVHTFHSQKIQDYLDAVAEEAVAKQTYDAANCGNLGLAVGNSVR